MKDWSRAKQLMTLTPGWEAGRPEFFFDETQNDRK